MAKKGSNTSTKITLNKKRQGKARKSYGPKDQKPKQYRGQGRC